MSTEFRGETGGPRIPEARSANNARPEAPDNAENRENGVWGEGKFPSLAEKAAQTRGWTTFSNIYVPDDRNSRNQVLGLVTSQAT